MSTFDTFGYSPCEHEDSAGPCYWDASTMGNGYGTSFVVHPDQSVTFGPTYLPPVSTETPEVQPAPVEVQPAPGSYPYALPLDALAETGDVDPVLAVTLGFVALATIAAGAMLRVLSTLGK